MSNPNPDNASSRPLSRTSPARPYNTYDSIPVHENELECNFDETSTWNQPLEQLTVDRPIVQPTIIGDNPFAQKRLKQDPHKAFRKKRKKLILSVYISVIILCFVAIGFISVLMMPQLTGYFWTDFDNYAFINGELLRYDNTVVASYNRYRDYMQQEVIYPGIFVDDIYVGGMTLNEAKEALGDENAASSAFSITINIGDKSWTLNNQNITASRDINSSLLKAYSYGRQNTTATISTQQTPFLERINAVLALRDSFVYIYSKQKYDYASILTIVDEINTYVTRDPVDSQILSFDFNTRTFSFSEDQPGVSIDAEGLYNEIIDLLEQGVTSQSITVSPTLTFPTITKDVLESTFSLIAAYTTSTSSDANRNNNINLACQTINGTVLLPDETFSFNATVGERTYANGYREAGAIAGGELIEEIGGGICQVSSTLFNAAARANLEIVSRSPHAWPSTYVDYGEDATVNWPNLDFKFKNNTDTPVFIITYYKNRKCTAEIWGASLGENVSIDLESTIVRTIEPPDEILYVYNPDLPAGTSEQTVKLRTGYVVDTYKVWYQNGVELKREYLHTSTYKAYQRTIEYN